MFRDDPLQALIKEALANNYDMKIAATRVLQANANLGITRADQFPRVNGSFGITNEHNFQFYGKKSPTFDIATLSLNYIVDFWDNTAGRGSHSPQPARLRVRTECGAGHVDFVGGQ